MNPDPQTLSIFICFQRNELTESIVYSKLASIEKNKHNKLVLRKIAAEEIAHYEILKKYTHITPPPYRWRILKFYWIARLLGITFTIKLMESGEENAHRNYERYTDYPDLKRLSDDEKVHEQKLTGLINEERLGYIGAVVLGLNDALVEFTGALAGFTLALNNSKLIALTGSITGIAAALSMASSEYLSTKADPEEKKHPVKAAIYTGIAYIITVIALVAPFIFITNALIALIVMLGVALLIIALFNYYYSVACNENFKKRFTEMTLLSFGVAAISFLIGYALKEMVGIEAS